MARRFNSRIHLVHVIGPPYLYDAWRTTTLPRTVSEFLVEAKEVAIERLGQMIATTGARRRITYEVASGRTVEIILERITSRRIDLVVMGTHGRNLVEQFFLGRTAERVVGKSPVPVTTVHSGRPPRRRVRRRLA
jgi:nucleotide-binding universal stress UspA family protein